jgi:two-component sensor histidine kinase
MKALHTQTIQPTRDALKVADFSHTTASAEHLLLREFIHRVNNELTSVIGFAVSIAGRSTSYEVKSAIAEVTDVLHRYAGVHRALQMPSHGKEIDAPEYVSALCHSLKRARLDPQGIELELASRPFMLRSDQCWRLGLIVSELIADSARHAFGNRGGTIKVELSASDSLAQCYVGDNGGARSPRRVGHGLKIVDALARELGGAIDYEFGTDGASSAITFPIHNDALLIDDKAIRPEPT